jgi:hypothetical protein
MTTYYSAQLDSARTPDTDPRNYPIEDYGKLRVAAFKFTNGSGGTYADGSEIELCKLAPGRKRILTKLCSYRVTAMSTARTLDIGHRAYVKSEAASVAEDDDAFVADKDISSAVLDTSFDGGASNLWYDMYSKGEVTIYATVDGGTIPNGAIIQGYIIYVVE